MRIYIEVVEGACSETWAIRSVWPKGFGVFVDKLKPDYLLHDDMAKARPGPSVIRSAARCQKPSYFTHSFKTYALFSQYFPTRICAMRMKASLSAELSVQKSSVYRRKRRKAKKETASSNLFRICLSV